MIIDNQKEFIFPKESKIYSLKNLETDIAMRESL